MTDPDFEVSGRGFKQLEPIVTSFGEPEDGTIYPRETIRVWESSAAESPHIWVKIQEPKDLNRAAALALSGETYEGEYDVAGAHMSLSDAEKLRDQLDWLINNHYNL